MEREAEKRDKDGRIDRETKTKRKRQMEKDGERDKKTERDRWRRTERERQNRETKTTPPWTRRYLQDRSGQVHAVEGQLVVVLRGVVEERLRSLRERERERAPRARYHGDQTQKQFNERKSAPPLPHLVSRVPPLPPPLFEPQGV